MKSTDTKHKLDELREKMEHGVEHAEAHAADLRRQMNARDKVEEKVDTLAKRIENRERAADAPFFVKWVRW
jgi:uncharacterized coiled-coil DUF342 family protein